MSGETDRYTVAGLAVAVRSTDAAVRDAVRRRLRRMTSSSESPPELRVDLTPVEGAVDAFLPGPLARARPVYDPPAGEVLYSEEDDLLLMRYPGRVAAVVACGEGRARIAFDGAQADARWIASHPILTLCLVEMLRRRSRFGVHAAALASNGRGILLAGRSGAGKSTLALTLLRAGLDFLGDDTCFLAPAPEAARILSFPDEVDVADRTVAFFPELRFLLESEARPGAAKRQLLPEEVYDTTFVAECAPGVLVFPSVGAETRSSVEPIGAEQALLELVPSILLTEPAAARRHLAALGRLVREVPCYRLRTGRDFDALPDLLTGLLCTHPIR